MVYDFGCDHNGPTVSWLKYCTSICLIRLGKSMKTSLNIVNDLAEIWARHRLNTCVVLPLNQLKGQQQKAARHTYLEQTG